MLWNEKLPQTPCQSDETCFYDKCGTKQNWPNVEIEPIKHVATIDLTKFSLCLRFAPPILSLADSGNLTELWSMELSSTLMKFWERLRRWSSVTNCWKLDYHTTLFITNCKEKIVIKFGTQGQTETKKQRALQWRVSIFWILALCRLKSSLGG